MEFGAEVLKYFSNYCIISIFAIFNPSLAASVQKVLKHHAWSGLILSQLMASLLQALLKTAQAKEGLGCKAQVPGGGKVLSPPTENFLP